jgi:Protein of unknown function (DUF1203)
MTSTTLTYLPMPSEQLRRVRAAGRDDFGNVVVASPAEAGSPLRCCLRLSGSGERVALIAHRPSDLGGPYAEVGPVYVHVDDCGGVPDDGVFPADFRDRLAVLRPYDAAGDMLDGVLAGPGQSERLLAVLFADLGVETVQVRNVCAGCWNFTVRRRPATTGCP